jgi:osmotically-inducible protein OsmY
MDRNDQGRYGNRDDRGDRPNNNQERDQGRWENEGGEYRSDDNRRWTESDQGSWQGRDDRRRPGEDRWGRFPSENRGPAYGQSYPGSRPSEPRQEWRGRDYPSSGTYGSSNAGGSYGSWGYQGERQDRDYRGSYDDSPNINRDSYPQARPYQQATGVAGQDRYRYEEQIRRGRPPRTYKRSDDRIHDEICEIVARQSDVDASQVDVKVESGEVTLSGEVADRRAKRELEDISERVFGVVDIHNELRVRKSFFNELGERIFGTPENQGQSGSKTQSSNKM